MFQRRKAGSKIEPQKTQRRATIDADEFFARHRRLERRIADCEAKVSTLRRDINRVDRMVYKDRGRPSLIEEEGVKPSQLSMLDQQIKELEGRYAL